MSKPFAEILLERFDLTEHEEKLLLLNKNRLTRNERRIFFQNLRPRTKEWIKQLKEEIDSDGGKRNEWADMTVDSLLAKGGEPDISDEIAMEIIGRFYIIHEVRKLAEKKGVVLKTLASLGGLGFVLIGVILLTAFILLFAANL